MSSTPFLDDVDPTTLDVISPEKYQREGYPHAEWTWLRANDPVRCASWRTTTATPSGP